MNKDYEKIFSNLDYPKHSEELFRNILSRIELERQLIAARRRLFWFSTFTVFSLPLIAFSWVNFQSIASESGLFQLLSLAFSDFSAIVSHYQDFVMSIAEAFPILAVAGLIGGILLLVESLPATIKNARMVYKLN